MANHISMGAREAITRLYEQGWKLRRIARELGLDRKTVRSHVRAYLASKGTIPPAGNDDSKGTILSPGVETAKGTILPVGKAGRPSQCERYHDVIKEALDKELSIQRIYQDLRIDQGFCGAYDSVKRYVRRRFPQVQDRVWRMECDPAEEAQVDFGTGAPIIDETGTRRRSHIFRIVLSYSRRAYSEAVFRQDTETFLRCIENAFRYFGGVPLTLILDNLKAAVNYADWYDPELNPKIMEFGRHYGVVILPTGPRAPEHKGKVESSVKYVKNNAIKARTFKSLAEENAYLAAWEASIADHRIHGTTREQVAIRFEREKPLLKPLASSLFPCFQEAKRQVHRDSIVEVAKAYYEVPPEYIGRNVWVRWDSHLVRVFNLKMEPVTVLARKKPGEFSSCLGSRGRSQAVEHTVQYWQERAAKIGEHCALWSEQVLLKRGDWGIRVIRGLTSLTRHHSGRAVDEACRLALTLNRTRLRHVKALLSHPEEQSEIHFLTEHPVIRSLGDYGALLDQSALGPAFGGHGSDEPLEPILTTAAGPAQAVNGHNTQGEERV